MGSSLGRVGAWRESQTGEGSSSERVAAGRGLRLGKGCGWGDLQMAMNLPTPDSAFGAVFLSNLKSEIVLPRVRSESLASLPKPRPSSVFPLSAANCSIFFRQDAWPGTASALRSDPLRAVPLSPSVPDSLSESVTIPAPLTYQISPSDFPHEIRALRRPSRVARRGAAV